MSIYYRYFRVTTGPLVEVGRALTQRRHEAFVAMRAFRDEIGASSVVSFSNGDVAGFEFDSPPDDNLWRQTTAHGYFKPKSNTKAGKALKARIEALPKMPSLSLALSEVGLCNNFPSLIDGHKAYSSVAFGAPERGVIFVKVPWRDADPKELAEYKQQRESATRTRWSCELDHLLWTPTVDMIEVKEWEVLREIDEINAAIKGEVTA